MKKLLSGIMSIVTALSALTFSAPASAAQTAANSPATRSATTAPLGFTPITNFQELYNIRSATSGNYILMNDIDLSETKQGGANDSGTGWRPLPEFKGVFDGNGHTISNMTIYGELSNAGFIDNNSGTVKNLSVSNVNIRVSCPESDDTACIGAIQARGSGTIDSCSVSGTINVDTNGNTANAGGIAGSTYYGSIKNSYSNAAITASGEKASHIGGIVGCNDTRGNIINCYNNGTVNPSQNDDSTSAGIAGETHGKISYCYTTQSNIYGNYSYSGASYCYCPNDLSGGNSGTTELADWQFKLPGSFVGFNFTDIWEILPGLSAPTLISNPEYTVKSVSLSKLPTKTVYNYGEKLDLSGGVISIAYNNTAAVGIETMTSDMLIGAIDMTKVGNQTVSLSFKGVGCSSTFDITVNPILVSWLSLSVSSLELNLGSSHTITASTAPANATDKTITWTTSDSSVVSVTNGTIKALKKGTATVTATAVGGLSASCAVTVKIPSTGIKLNKSKATLKKGATLALNASLTPADSTDSIIWTSSDNNVCTVTGGVVKALKGGTAVVTATASSGQTASCKINVSVKAKKLKLDKSKASMEVGGILTLKPITTPSDATDKIKWSTSNKKVCGVTDSGIVTGKKKGTATITAKTAGGKKAKCKITVKPKSFAVKATLKKSKKSDSSVFLTITNKGAKTVTVLSGGTFYEYPDAFGREMSSGKVKIKKGKTVTIEFREPKSPILFYNESLLNFKTSCGGKKYSVTVTKGKQVTYSAD